MVLVVLQALVARFSVSHLQDFLNGKARVVMETVVTQVHNKISILGIASYNFNLGTS